MSKQKSVSLPVKRPSVLEDLSPIELPSVLFYVDEDKHIHKIEKAEIAPSSKAKCNNIKGNEIISYGKEKHINVYDNIDAGSTFTTLSAAKEYIEYLTMQELRSRLRQSYYWYNMTQGQKTRCVKDYPHLAFKILEDQCVLPDDVTDASQLKMTHLREISSSRELYEAFVEAILDEKYPGIEDD